MVSRGRGVRVVGIGGTLRLGSSSPGALRRALEAAKEPGRPLGDHGPEVRALVEAAGVAV